MKRSLTQLRTDSRDCLAGNYGLCFIALFVLFLANLVLQMGESVEAARQYYEMGRLVGGPPSAALEKLLKGEK